MFGKVKIILPKALLGCGTDWSLFNTSHPAPSHTQCTNPAAPGKFHAPARPPRPLEPGGWPGATNLNPLLPNAANLAGANLVPSHLGIAVAVVF